MHRGYIKTYRCLLESPVWQNEKLLKVWLWCLLKARHEAGTTMVGCQTIELSAGQFLFGRRAAALETGYPESTIWRLIKTLEKMEMLNIKATNKYSVVTVENWGFYQGETEEETKKTRRKRTTSGQQVDTNKNVKNVKNSILAKNIIPPTLEMVTEYCLEANYPINPQKFMDYYDSNGWMVGNRKMKDWQATIRTWARREEAQSAARPQVEVKKYSV